MSVKNQVQLITYPDSLGGDLKTLNSVLLKYFPGIFGGGIHILPPFPSSGDRGFAPLTYLEIEPEFGTWDDIKTISGNFDVMLDLMVNHISRQSAWFQDYLKKGSESEFADLFITLDKIWPDGKPVEADIAKMFRRRTIPYSTFSIENSGETENIWTTFGKQDPSEQIDLDTNSNLARRLLKEFLVNFSKQNVKFVRLDAVGYIMKKPGTSCFFIEPEIYQFLEWISDIANPLGIELLPEVHANFITQFKLAQRGYWIYDFILPYTILDTLINGTSSKLCEYLKVRPHKQFTMLDCHDGVPVKPDMDGLINTEKARKLIDICMERGANLSLVFSDKHKADDGFDVHQIRGSYYSLLDCNDDAYMAARAIQFFAPGIPQVYYVGLLAGENDVENVTLTGEGREINRQNFSVAEIEKAVQKPVVQRLLKIIRFRNEYPAFNGEFSVHDSPDTEIHLSWKKDEKSCSLHIDLGTFSSEIRFRDDACKTENYII
jgi:sucrose phosphorylase